MAWRRQKGFPCRGSCLHETQIRIYMFREDTNHGLEKAKRISMPWFVSPRDFHAVVRVSTKHKLENTCFVRTRTMAWPKKKAKRIFSSNA